MHRICTFSQTRYLSFFSIPSISFTVQTFNSHCLLTLAWTIILSIKLIGQSAELPVLAEKIGLDNLKLGDGREVNLIYDILQDHYGFMWFGTYNGVVRYDGYNLTHFEPDLKDSTALQHKLIYKLKEDPSGNIWAWGGGKVHIYDQQTSQFQTIRNFDGDSLLRGSFLTAELVVTDSVGNLWMPDNNGLLKFQKEKKSKKFKVRRHQHEPSENPNGNNLIHAVLLDSENRLWIGTDNGLSHYDAQQDQVVQVNGCSAKVIRLFETHTGQVILGTLGSGLYLFDPKTEKFLHFLPDEKDATSIAGSSVRQIAKDGKGNVWLFAGDWESQVFSLQQFHPERGTFQSYFDSFRPVGLMGGSNLRLFVGRDGCLWIVTGIGLIKFDPYRELFLDHSKQNNIGDWGLLNDLYEDKTGVLWLATYGNGLYRHAPSTGKFDKFLAPYPGQSERQTAIFDFFDLPVFEDSQGYLWSSTQGGTTRYTLDSHDQPKKIAGYSFIAETFREDGLGNLFIVSNEGLKWFDLNTEVFKHCPELPFNLKPPYNLALIDRDGGFWFNTYGNGLHYFHPLSGVARNFRHDETQPGSISSDFLHSETLQDKDGEIWICSALGLNRYHPEDGTFTTYLEEAEVMHLHEDMHGIFWVSTSGQGLYRFNKETGVSKRYYSKNGFPARTLFSILEDERRDFWIPTDIGLLWLEPESEKFRLFNEFDGIPSGCFAESITGKRKESELRFPLRDGGILSFHPDSLLLDTHPPPTAIVGFKLFNREVPIGTENSPLAQTIWTSDQIILNHNENVFSLEYAALHFAAPAANRFMYKLEGLDREWNKVGNQRIINFAGLGPGNYTFRVKAANHDDFWNVVGSSLKVCILPPWWASWWAYSLYAIIFGWILWTIYAFQRRRWKLKVQLALEHREAERFKELDTLKTKLYTNITHEFRTPLTIILGMAKQVRENPKDWLREGIEMIIRNGNNLLQLVNQMLDLSKLESGSMTLNLVQDDILTFLKYLIESFHSLAEIKNIQLHFHTDLDALIMDYDPEKIREIIANLLSNAIKFSKEEGEIDIHAEVTRGSSAIFSMHVTDTGVGISPEEIPYIFDRFYQGQDTASRRTEGTGIGLALTKELVKLLNGEIVAESEVNEGTRFSVHLPVTRNAPLVNTSLSTESELLTGAKREGEEIISIGADVQKEQPVLLVVEDNADVVKYLQTILATAYRIEFAIDGQDGWNKAVEIIPDIMICDVMMPVMDGFALCDRLKKDTRTSHIPIIMLTAKADVSSRIEGLERGADAYLAKPFEKQELLVRLQKLLDLRKQLQIRYATLSGLLPSEDILTQTEDAFMIKLRDQMEAHFGDENFGIPDLCQALLMSRSQLYRKVAALTGKPAATYLRSFRLQKARNLLLSTSLTVSEISFQVGFKDLGHFSRSFRKEFGENPSDLRK